MAQTIVGLSRLEVMDYLLGRYPDYMYFSTSTGYGRFFYVCCTPVDSDGNFVDILSATVSSYESTPPGDGNIGTLKFDLINYFTEELVTSSDISIRYLSEKSVTVDGITRLYFFLNGASLTEVFSGTFAVQVTLPDNSVIKTCYASINGFDSAVTCCISPQPPMRQT